MCIRDSPNPKPPYQVRIAANRFYTKDYGKKEGDNVGLEDLNTPGTINSVDKAFKAHPIACTPL